MATTKNDIREWLERGKTQDATHVIVVCDTFDHGDYPVMVKSGQDPREIYDKYNGKDMQRVMEVYKLNMDWETQLNQSRSFNF